MSLDHRSDEARREEMLRLAARAEEAEGERDSMKARYEDARRETREARRRLEAVARSSRDFTKSARATMGGQHGLESELRERLARERAERGEAEASLRRMESLVDRLGVVVWEAEVSEGGEIGRFILVGKHCEEVLGYPRSRWFRSAGFWMEAIHPEDRERVRRAYGGAVREGVEKRVEFRAIAADGRTVWIEDLIQPVEDGGESRRRVRGIMVEVTGRRGGEVALRESEERLRLTLEAARMGDWSMNLASHDASRSLLHDRIFGHETMLPDWSYEAFLEHVHPEDRPFVGERFEHSQKTGEDWEFECRIIRADGEERWIWALGSVSAEADGEPTRMFGLVNDITERKRVEEALRGSEKRSRLLFEQAADAVFVLDAEWNIAQVNERACESLGYSREELLGMPATDIERGVDSDGFADVWREILGTGGPAVIEGVHRRRDGSTFPVEVSIGRFDEGGGEPSMLALARDVTARKAAEAEREAALGRERRAREQIAFLSDASRELAGFLDLDETLARAARLAVPRVAEWCVVSVLADDEYTHRLAAAFRSGDGEVEVRREDRLDDEVPEPVREVVRTGEPLLVESVDEGHLEDIAMGEEHLERLRSFGLESYAIAPLAARGRTFGTITFSCNDPKRRYDSESLDLLGNFADRAALALENSRLFERQRHTAKVLQTSLLPADLPEIPGLEAAACFEPLGEGVEVGGDFYDLFHASEGRWAVVIGDVRGKGPEAASVTALARYTLRSVARVESVPSRALETLNAAILEQQNGGDDRFCTVLHGNIHPKPGGFTLEFASGGHPLPVILRADGHVEEIGRHGTLLGVFHDPELFDSKASLAPGDAVVFYTDGVTEARRGGEQFGEERVMEAISSCAGLGAAWISAALEGRLHEFSGGALGDDAAILVLKAVGETEVG